MVIFYIKNTFLISISLLIIFISLLHIITSQEQPINTSEIELFNECKNKYNKSNILYENIELKLKNIKYNLILIMDFKELKNIHQKITEGISKVNQYIDNNNFNGNNINDDISKINSNLENFEKKYNKTLKAYENFEKTKFIIKNFFRVLFIIVFVGLIVIILFILIITFIVVKRQKKYYILKEEVTIEQVNGTKNLRRPQKMNTKGKTETITGRDLLKNNLK